MKPFFFLLPLFSIALATGLDIDIDIDLDRDDICPGPVSPAPNTYNGTLTLTISVATPRCETQRLPLIYTFPAIFWAIPSSKTFGLAACDGDEQRVEVYSARSPRAWNWVTFDDSGFSGTHTPGGIFPRALLKDAFEIPVNGCVVRSKELEFGVGRANVTASYGDGAELTLKGEWGSLLAHAEGGYEVKFVAEGTGPAATTTRTPTATGAPQTTRTQVPGSGNGTTQDGAAAGGRMVVGAWGAVLATIFVAVVVNGGM